MYLLPVFFLTNTKEYITSANVKYYNWERENKSTAKVNLNLKKKLQTIQNKYLKIALKALDFMQTYIFSTMGLLYLLAWITNQLKKLG